MEGQALKGHNSTSFIIIKRERRARKSPKDCCNQTEEVNKGCATSNKMEKSGQELCGLLRKTIKTNTAIHHNLVKHTN